MAHTYSISEFGLKLIKAYEGFRSVETKLVSGQRVIGYGHIYTPGEMVMLTKKRAEVLLLTDLAPYEALINTNVYAPLSQSQFDALVSLSFNIGEAAFLNSSVLYRLNTGQPLAAAAGFDEWRKSVIGGKTYIVDALVRRRTAEKALFLRPATGIVATPRHELPPARVLDTRDDDGAIDVFEKSGASGFVEQVPYSGHDSQTRDNQTNVLVLNETVADDDFIPEEAVDMAAGSSEADIEDEIADKTPSPIAMAAAEVSERLDRLIDNEQGVGQPTDDEYSLQTSTPIRSEQVGPEQENASNEEVRQIFPTMTLVEMDIPASIDYNLQASAPEDVKNVERQQSRPVLTLVEPHNDIKDDQPVDNNDNSAPNVIEELIEAKTDIQNTSDERDTPAPQEGAPITALQNPSPNLVEDDTSKGIGAYLIASVFGLLLLGGGLWKMKFAPVAVNTDNWSAFMAPIALLIGGLIFLGGLYYMIKSHIGNNTVN